MNYYDIVDFFQAMEDPDGSALRNIHLTIKLPNTNLVVSGYIKSLVEDWHQSNSHNIIVELESR